MSKEYPVRKDKGCGEVSVKSQSPVLCCLLAIVFILYYSWLVSNSV